MSARLSVIVITKNESQNIGRCLASVQWADEYIVVDSGSTDNTIDIARSFGAQVYEATDWQGYGIQKQRALSHATEDWVLHLDADEVVDEALKDVIIKAILHDVADAYRIPIRMYFYEKPMHVSSPKRHLRLFKREGARFSDDIVHEKILLPRGARLSRIDTPIRHYSYRDVSHAIYKMNQYSSYSAKIKIKENNTVSFSCALFSSLWMFFRCYCLQGGFLDGREGFILACLQAQGSFYRGVKQYYRDQDWEELP